MELWREMVYGRTARVKSIWVDGKVAKPMVKVFTKHKKVTTKV